MAIAVAQHQAGTDAGSGDIGRHDARAELHGIGFRAVAVVFVDRVAAITQLEDIGVPTGAAVEDVVTGAALQDIRPRTAVQGVVTGAARQRLVERSADSGQHVVSLPSDLRQREVRQCRAGPHGPIRELKALHLVATASGVEPVVDRDLILAITVTQHQAGPHPRGSDIGRLNTLAELHNIGFRAIAVVLIEGVATIAQFEEVDIPAGTTVEDIVAGAALQHIGARAAIEGVVTGPTGQ